MTAGPAISILLPVRDAGPTIDACLASIQAQTEKDWECLAVDDHSVDGSRGILDAWTRRDGRFRVLDAPGPGGIVAALEHARAHARAPLLARQDADDVSLPDRLERQRARMSGAGERLAVLGCGTRTPGRVTDGMRRYLDWLSACVDPEVCAREIWIESPLAHPTVVMRSEWIARVGGYRELPWPEDYDLWLRIHRAGGAIANLHEVLYEWNDAPGRLSRRDSRYSAESFLRCRLHHLRAWLACGGAPRPLIVWGAGRDGRRLARAWRAEREAPGPPAAEIRAFVDIDPRKLGGTRAGRPVLDWASAIQTHPGAFVVVAVGVPGAREEIRSVLTGAGLVEARDFVCCH
jgi:glycosyltransferase involved in cell wall biosynthesis